MGSRLLTVKILLLQLSLEILNIILHKLIKLFCEQHRQKSYAHNHKWALIYPKIYYNLCFYFT